MKIALISDVHSNIFALKKALKDAENNHVDQYFFLGDYITDGEFCHEVISEIQKYGDVVLIGNREKYIFHYEPYRKCYQNYLPIVYTYHQLTSKDMHYFKTLYNHTILKIKGYKILLLHGEQYFDDNHGLFPCFDNVMKDFDFDVCIFGHIHRFIDVIYKKRRFICPGSIGIPVDTPFYKYCIMDIDETLKIDVRQFDVSNDFDEFQKLYQQTNYYKENRIWSDIILKSICDGKDYTKSLIKNTKNRMKDEEMCPENFNPKFEEEYYCFKDHYNIVDYSKLYRAFKINGLNKIQDLIPFIRHDIQDGYMDIRGRIWNSNPIGMLYYLQNPMELLQSRRGLSFDIIELCRIFLERFGFEVETYFLQKKNDVEKNHIVLVFYENDKVYWLEPILESHLGIYEYSNIDTLLIDAKKYIQDCIGINQVQCYQYCSLKYHSSIKSIYKQIQNGFLIDLK